MFTPCTAALVELAGNEAGLDARNCMGFQLMQSHFCKDITVHSTNTMQSANGTARGGVSMRGPGIWYVPQCDDHIV